MAGIKLKGAAAPARSRARTSRWMLWILVVLLLLTGAGYFTVTSSAFLKRFVLPRVGAALHANLTAGTVSLSPFSKLEISNLTLQPAPGAPLLTCAKLHARYSLIAFLKGRIEVSEIYLESPTINLSDDGQGHSNLDPLLADAGRSPAPKSTGPAPIVDVRSVVVTNLTFRSHSLQVGARPQIIEVTGVNLRATDLRNGSPGKFELGARLNFEPSAPTNAPAGGLTATVQGQFDFTLDAALRPTALQGQAAFSVATARGPFADLAGVTASLRADASPTAVKELALTVSQSGNRLGEIRVHGPFDSTKREGKLNLEVSSIDRHVLNLAGAAAGFDFGATTINTTNEIEVAQAGNVISIFGDLRIQQLQLLRAGNSTPRLDLVGDYSLAIDQNKKSALLGAFKLKGTQQGKPALQATLSSPMPLTWGQAADTAGTSTLTLTVLEQSLADWKPFVGTLFPAGKVRFESRLTARGDGRVLNFEARLNADGLSILAGDHQLTGVNLTCDATGEAIGLRQFKISEYGAQVFSEGQPAFSFQGNASYDQTTAAATTEVSVLAALPQLVTLFPGAAADVSSGVLSVSGNLSARPGTNFFGGKLHLVDLTGNLAGAAFDRFGAALDFEAGSTPQRVSLRQAAGVFSVNSKPGGRINITGNFSPANGATDFALRLEDLNQNVLRPFIEPHLVGKKLTTAALRSTATFAITPTGATTFTTDVALTNLTATELSGGKPSAPLAARFQLDAGLSPQDLQLRQCLLTLTPTEQAQNQLTLGGTLRFPKTNVISGSLKLAAASLDLTKYFDLVSAPAKPGRAVPPTVNSGSTTDAPAVEPAALGMQFTDATAEVTIDRLVVREVTLEKLSARARLEGRHLVLKPCFVSLNGAPLNAALDLDLGVPGFRYDLNCDAQGVPLAPVVNTFQPDRRGQLHGQFSGTITLRGQGLTGPNLKQHLTGEIVTLSTNLNLAIVNTRTPVIRAMLDSVLGIPDLIRNPLASVDNLLGRLVNFGGTRGGWSDQLMSAPIEVVETRLQAGNGRVQLQSAEIRSAAFKARATGELLLAAALEDSTLRIPISLSLNRPLASQIDLVPADAPTNAAYYAMPQFLQIRGTLGKPEPKLDKLALAELAARSGAGVVKGLGGASAEKVGGLLQKGGNLLGGFRSSSKPTTNSPSTSQTNSSGVFDLFK